MLQTKFGECELIEKETVMNDESFEYVGFSWVTETHPIYGKEDHGYLIYKKENKLFGFKGHEPGTGRTE